MTASYATSTQPAGPSTAGDRARILELLGGRRGIVDGALPPLMFVAVNAVAGTQLPFERWGGGATRASAGGSPSRRSAGPWSTPPAPSQAAFCVDDSPGFLAVTKLVLGWPLTALAVVPTLAYVRRVRTPSQEPQP